MSSCCWTGSNGGVFIQRGDAERFDWLETFATVEGRVRGVNTVGQTERLNLPLMMIGPFTLENVIVTVQAEGETTNVGLELQMQTGTCLKKTDSDGLLGYDVLKHFIVTIYFKRSLLNFEPAPGVAGTTRRRSLRRIPGRLHRPASSLRHLAC